MIILKPWAVYNEIEEYAADWLENLITLGVIAPGIVDRRSIVDIRPDDYRGFRQAHFFAGIGVWSYALRRSGISDDTALWTGSCPCQPFSAAGAGGGVDDERHLWPHWFHLIRERRPDRVYGEQVASKDGLGWLDLVWSDLEDEDYAIGPFDTCSAGSGAPHIRQRLRFRADNLRSAAGAMEKSHSRDAERCASEGRLLRAEKDGEGSNDHSSRRSHGVSDRLDDSLGAGLEGQRDGHSASTGQREGSLRPVATAGGIEWVADDSGLRPEHSARCGSLAGTPGADQSREAEWERLRSQSVAGGSGPSGNMADTIDRHLPQSFWGAEGGNGSAATYARTPPNRPGPTNGFWRDADWLFCRDGKWRPVSATSQSMADGFTADLGLGRSFPLIDGKAFKEGSGHPVYEGKSRQGMLKGYGNAIDAEATIDFIEATLDTIDHESTGSVLSQSTEGGLDDFEDML